MAYSRIAAVTGANKGIGLAIVRNLALRYQTSPLNNGPLLIYLTARNEGRGETALKDIYENDTTIAKVLRPNGGLVDIKYEQLDISDKESIKRFEGFLKEEHPGGIDVLVNNAGVSLDGFDAKIVSQVLGSNYYGTLDVTESLLPHMRRGNTSRIVNVSSMVGKLNKYSPEITAKFREAKSVADITALMNDFQRLVEKGTHQSTGWPTTAYGVSKAGLTGATMFIGKKALSGNGSKAPLVNACCPGYVNTDMTKGRGRKTPDAGAKTPVHLALDDLHGVGGEFWENEEVSQW